MFIPSSLRRAPRRPVRSPIHRPGRLAAVLLGSGLAVAACGGTPPSAPVAQVQSTPTHAPGTHPGSRTAGSGHASLLAFAHCMQTHGVPDFPDPNSQGNLSINAGPNSDLNPTSPTWQAAQHACRRLQPAGHAPSAAQLRKAQAQSLAFSACMRSHGVPTFPDPTFHAGGGISIQFRAGTGIDPRSPQFQAAQTACQSLQPGSAGYHHHSRGPGGGGGAGPLTAAAG